jgi:hypothetical protein
MLEYSRSGYQVLSFVVERLNRLMGLLSGQNRSGLWRKLSGQPPISSSESAPVGKDPKDLPAKFGRFLNRSQNSPDAGRKK